MKEYVYFYASEIPNLEFIPISSKVYSKKTNCILQLAYEVCSRIGINPTYGTLYSPEDGLSEIKFIERYKNQFECLNHSASIYVIAKNKISIDQNNILTKKAKFLREIKLDNLYDYLNKIKNVKLLNCNYHSNWFYDIPYDNGDIIRDYFLKIITENDKSNQKEMIVNIKEVLPQQKKIISDLYKLISKMGYKEAHNFINNIYIKTIQSLDYSLINQQKMEHNIKSKIKSLFSK